MTALLPFVIVALAAIALVVLELLKTFGRDVLEALRSRWAWALIGVNVLVALAVYVIVRLAFNTGDAPGTAVFVGLSFPILLRSRFTYFRAVGAKEDSRLDTISLKIDEAYSALQDLCWAAVDEVLADRRAALAEKLAARYSAGEMIERIEHHIDALRIEANQARDRQWLEDIKHIPDEKTRKFRLAMMIIDINPSMIARLLRRR